MSVSRLKQKIITVTTAGTKVAAFSAPFNKISSVLLRAPKANTGDMYFGDTNVSASGDLGIKLSSDVMVGFAGDSNNGGGTMLIESDNLYVDATVNGEKLVISYVEVT